MLATTTFYPYPLCRALNERTQKPDERAVEIQSVGYAKQITLLTINVQNGTQLRRAFIISLLLAIDSID